MCKPSDIARYQNKISGPILDRIDLRVEVGDIEQYEKPAPITHENVVNETAAAKERIAQARARQRERFGNDTLNSTMSHEELSLHSGITTKASSTLLSAAEKFNLSMRSYHKLWRVARTIADLDNSPSIEEPHILEAMQFRHRE